MKPAIRYFVKDGYGQTLTSKAGKPYRQQQVLCVQGDEQTLIRYMPYRDEPFLEVGEHRLAPDAVFVGEVVSVDRNTGRPKTETGLRVGFRFVKVSVVAAQPKAA